MENLTVNYHIKDSKNVGDEMCAPAHYFDIKNRLNITSQSMHPKVSIYGGGAIANIAVKHHTKNRGVGILWGVGTTSRNKMALPTYKPASQFVLQGIRDYQTAISYSELEWVPCASCMSKLFDDVSDPIKDCVYYGHKILSPLSEMNNDEMDFAKVIKHLSSGETVITSSYHGVYWATLLGRKVLCLPFGSKFFGFKHPPVMIKRSQLASKLSGIQGNSYPFALEECREANLKFWEKVKSFIT